MSLSDERDQWDDLGDPAAFDYDLIILGTGSGNSLIGPEMDDWRIAIVERGVFGGTCLNRGCIPSKMLIHTAEVAETIRHGRRLGVTGEVVGVDWPGIVQRVFGRIDPIAEGGRQYRHSLPNVTVYEGEGRFVGPRAVAVHGQTIRGRQIVVATGARPHLPDVAGLDPRRGATVPFHTSDTIMRIEALPRHLVIVGGGFIAVEMAHLFTGLGSEVTIVTRGPRLMRTADEAISQRLTEAMSARMRVVLNAELAAVHYDPPGVTGVTGVTGDDDRAGYVLDVRCGDRLASHPTAEIGGDALLIATGRTPTGDQLDAGCAGIELNDTAVAVDQFGRTSAPGVWALGDVNGRHQLKHMANGEARVVRHNLTHPGEPWPLDDRDAPYAVFAEPQIGAVGPTEAEARARYGDDLVAITHDYAAAAYGWALEDTTGFVKLLGLRSTGTLVGAHVVGYHAATLAQLLIQGMHLGNTVEQLATGQIWIHPALPEVVEQALLKLLDELGSAAR